MPLASRINQTGIAKACHFPCFFDQIFDSGNPRSSSARAEKLRRSFGATSNFLSVGLTHLTEGPRPFYVISKRGLLPIKFLINKISYPISPRMGHPDRVCKILSSVSVLNPELPWLLNPLKLSFPD